MKHFESGRSMLEILGVLAIMLLITIGGIKGYEKITKKVQAQSISEAIAAAVKEVQTRGLYSSGYKIKGPHGDLEVENATSNKKKGLFLVKTRLANKVLCEELLAQSGLIEPVAFLVNGTFDGECPGEVTFVFNKNTLGPFDLTLGEGTSSSTYGEPVAGEPCDGDTLSYDEMRCNSEGDCFYCTNDVWTAGNCTCGSLQGTDCSNYPQNRTICQDSYVYRCSERFWRQIQQCSSACDKDGKVCQGDTTTPQAENTTCYDGYYVNGDSCAQCPTGTALCTDAEVATSCISGYYLSSGSCLVCPSNAICEGGTDSFECISGYESNQASTACVACTTGEECATCNESTPLWDGQNCVAPNVCSNYSGTAASNTTVNGVTYSGGSAGVGTDSTTTCKCPAGYAWDTVNNSGCVDWMCITQAECGGTNSGYFCYYRLSFNDSEDPATAMGCAGSITAAACLTQNANARVGQCKAVNDYFYSKKPSATIEGLGDLTRSKDMNWWSAVNWCQGQGMNLFNLHSPTANKLQCANENLGTGTNTGYCCDSKNASCGSDVSGQSPIMQRLRNSTTGLGTSGGLWTQNVCGTDSRITFTVNLAAGSVINSVGYRSNRGYAWCED